MPGSTRSWRTAVPLAAIIAVTSVAAGGASLLTEARAGDEVGPAAGPEHPAAGQMRVPAPARHHDPTAGSAEATTLRTTETLAEAPPTACRVPRMAIPKSTACSWTARYPNCRYRLPDPGSAGHLYSRWRLTDEERWWGGAGLVTTILAVAADYARTYPGETVVVGDLDAEGPRHATHRNGVDVDLYLPGMMAVDNPGGYEYPDNYEGRSPISVWARRTRVVDLAKILSECTGGRLRIYYNDEPTRRRFLRWFGGRGYSSPFGAPMQEHNDLHRFHFHVSLPSDLPPLPFEDAGG